MFLAADLVDNFFNSLSSGSVGSVSPIEAALAMLYSLVLNLVIATIYRLTYRGARYSQDYVQTLIMIGAVTTILIMVVSSNGAIAFGMFAAFSVIRFRRTLGQSRDLGFVFFAMAIGMVVGAQQYAMAAAILGIVGTAIVVLTYTNAFAPRRASHLLTMRFTNDIDFEGVLTPILGEYTEAAHLIRVSSAQAGMMTELRYGIQLKPDTGMASFLEALQLASGNNRVVITPTAAEFDS